MWGWQFANLEKEKPLGCGLDNGVGVQLKMVKVSSYIAKYPILRITQSALHFTSLTDLFNQTPSQLLKNLPKVLTSQHRIRTRVLSVEPAGLKWTSDFQNNAACRYDKRR